MTLRIGVDTGGTFSDFLLLDDHDGRVWTAKVPSTPDDPARAVRAGLEELMRQAPGRIGRIVVGTTVATNAVIERRGPRIVYVANEGFTDVPFIGRLDKEHLYDLHWCKPKPLVRRRDCVGVPGRIGHDGAEIAPLPAEDLERFESELRALSGEEDTAVAVCLLFSYVEPDHEQRVRDAVRRALPAASVSISHEVSPTWREYERASTTIADAFLKAGVEDYVDGVGAVVRETAGATRWNLLASNGGYLRAERARHRPAQLLLSGLAGGVIGAAFHARGTGYESVFSLDMGGTSCDIGLVLGGEQQYANEFNLAFGLPVSIPCVAVTTIGAGGGSIAWLDRGGLLHVGPRSAGAEPGPVAYGHGGTEPTVTDANLVLGRLDPAYFLGGDVALDADGATAAVAELAGSLELDPVAGALAIVDTADENMANAIRLIAVDRGIDTRELALIAFGGAGPLHARAVAQRLDMTTVLVPPQPGLCSAFGAAIARGRVDRTRTFSARSTDVDLDALAAAERRLREDAVAELRRSIDGAEPVVDRVAGMRYEGQNYELDVALPGGDLDAHGWDELLERFEREHEMQYGFALPGEVVELINLRATAVLEEPLPLARPAERAARSPGTRQVHFDGEAIACPIVPRDLLAVGEPLEGPAIVEDPDSTTLVWPGDTVMLLPSGVLEITIGAAS
jgi:N-methylhydantoinase A